MLRCDRCRSEFREVADYPDAVSLMFPRTSLYHSYDIYYNLCPSCMKELLTDLSEFMGKDIWKEIR